MRTKKPIINIQEEKRYSGLDELKIFDAKFSNQTISFDDCKKEFNSCVFENCTITGEIEGSFFYHLIFKKCDLSNLKMKKCGFHCVEYIDCKLIGTEFMESILEEVYFSSVKASYLLFCETRIKHSSLIGIMMPEGYFDRVTFLDVLFEDCDLTKATFQKTALKGLDFSSSCIEGINISAGDLRGLVIDYSQAELLVGMLGVKIKS